MTDKFYVPVQVTGESPDGHKQIRLIQDGPEEVTAVLHERCLVRPAKLEPCWKPVWDEAPPQFVSVLGYIPDLEPTPTVMECYLTDKCTFYVPGISSFEHVTHWCPMPEYKKAGEA